MSGPMYLGLDLGTSGLKALILDEGGAIVALATAPLSVQRPALGYSEQDPASWIEALGTVLLELKAHIPHIRAVGLAGHMHGLVLLDKQDKVLRPCILWNDTRAHELAAHMDATAPFHALSGNLVFSGFSAPKMAWVRDQEPEIWARADCMLFPKDYLGLYLTGNRLAEPSDAAGSSLFDCENATWSEDLCAAANLPRTLLPDIIPSGESRGTLSAHICEEYGFSKDVVVAGGAGDNAAAALGAGRVQNSQGLLSLGTSGVLLTVNEAWCPQPETAVHSFCHSVDRRFIQMGVTLCATDSLVWFADLVGSTPKDLCAALPHNPGAPGDILFHPYLSGERTPHNFSGGFGNFLHLDRRHGRADLTQAILEGVAYSFADCCTSLEQAGARVDDLILVGGGGNIAFLVQTLANALGRPLQRMDQSDHVAAIGAAHLGRAAANQASVLDVLPPAPEPAATITPLPGSAEPYAHALDAYRVAFSQLKERSHGNF